MKKIFFLVMLAVVFWFFLFSPQTAGKVNFWLGMCVATAVLSVMAFREIGPEREDVFSFRWQDIGTGVFSAFLLYGVFWAGRHFLTWIFPEARGSICAIYGSRSQASAALVGCLLFFWIGPAEEIFWRACVQRRLQKSLGLFKALLLSSALYALVHVFSGNPVLLLAALVCGLWWGGMFILFRRIWPGMISHALWDVLVFVVFPLA